MESLLRDAALWRESAFIAGEWIDACLEVRYLCRDGFNAV